MQPAAASPASCAAAITSRLAATGRSGAWREVSISTPAVSLALAQNAEENREPKNTLRPQHTFNIKIKQKQQAGLSSGCVPVTAPAAASNEASFGCPGLKHFEENGFGELRTGGSCLNRNENGRFLFESK